MPISVCCFCFPCYKAVLDVPQPCKIVFFAFAITTFICDVIFAVAAENPVSPGTLSFLTVMTAFNVLFGCIYCVWFLRYFLPANKAAYAKIEQLPGYHEITNHYATELHSVSVISLSGINVAHTFADPKLTTGGNTNGGGSQAYAGL
jgi:hypothetical protein